jgi:hypothetical protein
MQIELRGDASLCRQLAGREVAAGAEFLLAAHDYRIARKPARW